MDKRWLIIGFGAGIISFGLITTGMFDENSEQSKESSIQSPPTQASTIPSSGIDASRLNNTATPSYNTGSETQDDQVKLLAQAKQDVVDAQDALNIAESELGSLESEMEEVERFIEGLEQQGENPAEFAEEGMLLLRPIIENYEAKLAIVEDAERQLKEAERVLASFEQ